MNKEKFIDCLRDPSLLQDSEIRELNQLVKRYPYFQGARALLAKVSKERNLKDAAHRISSAAVYTTDRALLKKYISDHLFFLDSREAVKEEKTAPKKTTGRKTPRPPVQGRESVKQVPSTPGASATKPDPSGDQELKLPPKPEKRVIKPSEDVQPPVSPKAPQVSKERPTQRPKVAKKEVLVKPAPPSEEELSSLQESSTNLDDWIKEIHEDIEALKKSKARFLELDKKLEEEEKKKEEEDAVNAALKKVTDNKKPVVKKSVTNAEPEAKISKSKPPKKETPPVKEESEIDKKEEKPAKAKTPIKKKTPVKKKTSVKKTATKKAEKKPDPIPKEVQAETKPEELAPEIKELPTKKKEAKAEEEDNSTLKVVRRRSGKVKSTTFEAVDQEKPEEENKDKIIDEFISTSPKISKGDKSKLALEEDKEDLSDTSSRFKADIGTEYLAEIYVEQGKIERAISIYEKLSLKFPEKRPYFVARIEELKSK